MGYDVFWSKGNSLAGVLAHRVCVANILDKTADFDGDEMVLSLHLDKYTADLWAPTRPSEGALDQNKALAYSGDLDLPKPMTLQFYRYLGYDKK